MNMRKFTRFFLCAVALMALAAVVSCSSVDDPTESVENGVHSCRMIFNVTKSGFDDELDTRSSAQWENGDTIYLLFSSAKGLVYGDAVYKDGDWYVNYNGNLTQNQETNCRAYYFENSVSSTHADITLNENTAIYEDTVAKYTYIDGSLSVTANLKPKTGRMRFKGTNHEEVKIYGITRNISFNRYTGKYSTTKGIIKAKVDTEYTPYIYGEFTDTVEPRVNVWRDSDGFTRLFPTTIFKAGQSGYVTIPTSSAHNGWQANVILKVNGVAFTMIPVKYTTGNFLLAQTETTEELYEAIMKDGKSSQLPKTGIDESGWSNFLSTLNKASELKFEIPTYSVWKFAFKGGNNSQNFTYSGSNNINDVAWYKDNSNGTPHDVATKQPNELGFYDMSGNVWEYVASERIDGYSYSFFGGNYECSGNSHSYSDDCDVNSRLKSCSLEKYGLRFAMSND